MSCRVKICGVKRPEDALLAAELGAWAVGVIFHPESPRAVDAEGAMRVFESLPPGVRRVGVFVNARLETMLSLASSVPLDMIQLHGGESDEIAEVVGLERVVRALSPRPGLTPEDAAALEASYLLLDRPRDAAGPAGGPVDLDFARRVAELRPDLLLAGGLDARSVGAAVRAVRPFGVDVSSGVEFAPGMKDEKKMRDFFAAVRGAEGGA